MGAPWVRPADPATIRDRHLLSELATIPTLVQPVCLLADAPISPLQHVEDGVGEDLGAQYDVLVAGVLGPVVADAADGRHE